MQLDELLKDRETAIIDRWFALIIATYPADASGFLKNQKNRFLNPVGNTIEREIGVLFKSLLRMPAPDELTVSIDNILKIRAVQEFTPAQAVGFVFLVKRAVREVLNIDIDADPASVERVSVPVHNADGVIRDLSDFDRRVDELALKCFDSYSSCRERIYEVRLDELRRRATVPYFSHGSNSTRLEQDDD